MKVLLAIQRQNKNFTITWTSKIIPNNNDKITIKGTQFTIFERHFLPTSDTLIIYLSCKKEIDEYYLYYLGFTEYK